MEEIESIKWSSWSTYIEAGFVMKCTSKIWKKNDEKIYTRKISLAMKSFAKDILQIILNREENLWNQWNS